MSEIITLENQVLKKLSQLPNNPGVYKFFSPQKKILYIGKAKNISSRTKSYFSNIRNNSNKLKALISEASFLEITLTSNELEALLLEQHLIKEHHPKFNIQFKDDKGYPWIVLQTSKEYPAAKSYLGRKKKNDLYYGPFPSSLSSKEALNLIQKVFKLRDCSDTFFKNRSRPCMQYQIGKCSAPCVSLITKEEYAEEVKSVQMLLKGKGHDLISSFYTLMDKSAKNKLYERAASYRDKISSLRDIQRSQTISGFSEDRDAVSVQILKNKMKIGITSVRGGWIVKHENYFQDNEVVNGEELSSFLSSHYLYVDYCPKVILIKTKIDNKETIQKALSKTHNRKIKIITKPTSKDLGLLNICEKNTKLSIRRNDKKQKDLSAVFRNLKQQFNLNNEIKFIESYDISHHSSKNAVGGCVVFNKEGRYKEFYRTYNIEKNNSGNDIASMREIIKRRFKDKSKKDIPMPELVLIDGGYNHLKAVKDEIAHLGIKGIGIISVSKGTRRKPQMDSFHTEDGRVIKVNRSSKVHLLLQEIRDETHRFSLFKQRKKELRSSRTSLLDSIEGIGKKRKTSLLRYFGSLDQISKASSQDLKKVQGIGKKIADLIYYSLN